MLSDYSVSLQSEPQELLVSLNMRNLYEVILLSDEDAGIDGNDLVSIG